jgi:hypothetical protein
MTEAEWLRGTDPALLFRIASDFASDRKLRLFACACGRRVLELVPEDEREQWRRQLEMTERYADGLGTQEELLAAWRGLYPNLPPPLRPLDAALRAVSESFGFAGYIAGQGHSRLRPILPTGAALARAAIAARSYAVDAARAAGGNEARAAEWRYQAALLRELFGNPFRPPEIEPVWLTWNDGFIPEQARLIYDERAFERLPILGDALEDAGCTDTDTLNHCRLPAEHVRGCWLVDALLAKG